MEYNIQIAGFSTHVYDVMELMRDHFEGTDLDMTKDML